MISLIVFSPIVLLFFTLVIRGEGVSASEIYIFLYVYFFGGPIFARELGFDIYSGINTDFIESSVFIFLISIISFYFGGFFGSKNRLVGKKYISTKLPSFSKILLAPPLFIIVCGLLWGFFAGAFSGGVNKVERITLLGIYHYIVVTLMPCFFIVYMGVFKRQDRDNKYYYFLLVLYAIYSYLTDERDFLLFAVPVYFWWIGRVRSNLLYPVLMFFVLVSIFVMISFSRDGVLGDGFLSSFLNQGSSLMVLTNVLAHLEITDGFIFGSSYASALINTFTLGMVRIGESMSTWLSNYYSGGASAYGFSLEAEAYFNFGYVGVILVFFVIGFYSKRIELRAKDDLVLGRILYFHFLFFFIYAIRGESLVIFKSILYCYVIFILAFISSNDLKVARNLRSLILNKSNFRGGL